MPDDQQVDVLIIGAGLSGITATYFMKTHRSNDKILVLEKKATFGGTWHTHKFPGVRADSDLFTFGFSFKPWIGPPIATGEEITKYLREVVDEYDMEKVFSYGQVVNGANWCSKSRRWIVHVTDIESGESYCVAAKFLWMAQGYFRHEKGYTPYWPGFEDYEGEVLHPQTWPDNKDLSGRRVVIIGSGATAASVVPAIAGKCEHVTMLQRSPTYFMPERNGIELAEQLQELNVDPKVIHDMMRVRRTFDNANMVKRCRDEGDAVKVELLELARQYLPDGFDIEKHFTPSYRPWQQRIALIPDGDLFKALARPDTDIVTDQIDHFTRTGIKLKSGDELQADTIITATGFELCILGDIAFSVDEEPLNFHDTVTYRGMMCTKLPNMVWVFGYFRASWTLRSELVAAFVIRLLDKMEESGASQVEVALRPSQKDMKLHDWLDEENFNPGYLLRSAHLLPKRGTADEWRHTQHYWGDKDDFPNIDLDDEVFIYDGVERSEHNWSERSR